MPLSHRAATRATGGTDAAATATATDPQDVALYLTLNNTTHKNDELPEALSALRKAEREGLGHKELLAISDPYWTKDGEGDLDFHDETYKYAFGEGGKDRLTFWHDDPELEQGQVKLGEEVLTLGTSAVDPSDEKAVAKSKDDWTKALLSLGMDEDYTAKTVKALLEDQDGNFRALASGDGATNELIQYAMAMYRSEKDEIDVKDIVLSGHHYEGGEDYATQGSQGIWGEIPGASQDEYHYDSDKDQFGFKDMTALKGAFPKAYGKVESVQLAACNTHHLGLDDENGNMLTTEQWMQGTFENIQMGSYWNDYAPKAAYGFETNGEFLLDATRQQHGKAAAAKDSRHNVHGLKRALLDSEGKLAPITMKTNQASYTGGGAGEGSGDNVNGLRGRNTKAFDQRTDLKDYIYQGTTLPSVTPKPVLAP